MIFLKIKKNQQKLDNGIGNHCAQSPHTIHSHLANVATKQNMLENS